MTDRIKEQLSAFVDDELELQELDLLLRRLESETELQDCLSRYQLASDAIKEGATNCDLKRMRQGIMDAIGSMPQDNVAHSIPNRNSAAGVENWRHYLKPFAGGAIAASVAAFSLFMIMQPGPSNTDPISTIATNNQVPVINRPPVTVVATSTAPQQKNTASEPDNQMQWERMSPEMRARLSGYLVNHGGYSRTNNMTGVPTGYVRIVGSQSEEQTEAE